VRDRLYGMDATLVSVRNEIAVAAESLDDVHEVKTADVPPPPPPPTVIDLTEAESNSSHMTAGA
jgi:hypothetical protein